jgi:hypothetical protein
MKLFEKEIKKAYLKYHTEPIAPNSLDPRVWYFAPQGGEPILQPEIKAQIIYDIDRINSAEQQFVKTRVWDYFLVGPILKEGSSEKAPINIIVQINTTNLSDLLKEHILNTIKQINGRLATGSLHPIYYIPTVRKFDPQDHLAVYHPYTDKWIKKPRYLGEAKTDLEPLHKDAPRKFRKYSLKKGVKKITTV